MPQPIKRACEVHLTGLPADTAHSHWLGQIVALSGHLEALLGHLLAFLTEASASVTIPMFHAVSSTDAQRAMLTAAAEQRLVGAELEEFRDLMSDFRTRYGERSRLVHNLWGTAPDHPGKAVWCAAKDSTQLSATLASMRDKDQLDMFMSGGAVLWRKCSLYSVKDLEDVFKRLLEYDERVRLFVEKLREAHPIIGVPEAGADAPASDAQAIAPPPERPPDRNQG